MDWNELNMIASFLLKIVAMVGVIYTCIYFGWIKDVCEDFIKECKEMMDNLPKM